MEQYNDTRMTLLRGSFTDEEERDKDAGTSKVRNSFLGKEKKLKHFLFL